MNKYTPFLKFKANEMGALKLLKKGELEAITPFFDLATKNEITAKDIENTIVKGIRKYEINFSGCNRFYLDDHDLDDSLRINGDIIYQFIVDNYSTLPYIPVVGLDRSADRVNVLLDSQITSDVLALRLKSDDFLSYTICEGEIADLMELLVENENTSFSKVHLIIDCRVCREADIAVTSTQISNFITEISADYDFEKIIITGSSISSKYVDNVEANKRNTIERVECFIYNAVEKALALSKAPLEFGDYTVITPEYSDVDIPVTALRKVMTPKVVYSYDRVQYFLRGGAIDSHPDGARQYDTLCNELVNLPFFRGEKYSEGDKYISMKAQHKGNNAQPGVMNKHLINAHMTFMLKDYA